MRYRVCVVTGTRADYGLLKGTLLRLRDNKVIDLDLLVTGSHLSEVFGNTQIELQNDGFDHYSRLPIPIDDDSKGGMARATGTALIRFSEYFNVNRPELLVILGDRYEALAAAIAAQMCGIPIAHISGGDVTEGAIDDAIRHSITKMSQLHFAGCAQSAKRIIQMGEQPTNVFNVGEPGVENCLKTHFMDRGELAACIGFSGVLGDYSVVTYHPVTMENNTGLGQVKQLIQAMDDMPGMSYIITMANADAGGRAINNLWLAEGEKRSNWFVISSLGVHRYLSAVKYAQLVIGNSSSGIIEAPAMGVPTVNIGDRQKGRMIAESVICCDSSYSQILGAMQQAVKPDFKEKAKHVNSPFGNGSTSKLIEEKIVDYLLSGSRTLKKHFLDINFKQ